MPNKNISNIIVSSAQNRNVGIGKRILIFTDLNPWIVYFSTFIIFIVFWEILGHLTNPVLFAPLSRVISEYPELISSGKLPKAMLTTISAMLLGYFTASVTGILFGLWWGRSRFLQDIVEPYLNALYALPRVALIPLVIVWIGIGFWGRFFIIFYGTVFDTMINTYTGVRSTEKTLLEVGKSFGANERNLFLHIIIPYSVPFIMAGLRLGLGRALVGVIVAEMFLQMVGMGGLILVFGETHRIASMLAVVILLSIMGILFTELIKKIERIVAPWNEYNEVEKETLYKK
ncbi:MAG TPA: ABC transporter permease [Candidatus Marinimicrobia bacterium]|jgi:NitT/TauT family transport system permease protein|nr:ABC transporter permease [Candidatus Neomarinimicrobiota bacterium]